VYFASRKGRTIGSDSIRPITEQARHEYTLAYVPAGNDKGSSYHKIEVHRRSARFGRCERARGITPGPPDPTAKQ